MDTLTQHLNIIRLHGTAEQLEETRLLFLEMMRETESAPPSSSKPEDKATSDWLSLLDQLKPRLDNNQTELLAAFLVQQVEEINSRRERDITLI